jgi:hypothetical protein
MKAMHRLIMTSDTYRQASAVTAQHERLDPSNQLWSRMPMRRMAAEELRDSLLAVAGQLNPARYGPAEPVIVRGDGLVLSGKRRSVYVQQLRKEPPSLLESFDLPAMNPNCLQRSESLVAPQALHLLNDSAIREMAGQFACRVLQSADANAMAQVREIYALALCRSPSDEELEACLDFLNALRASAVTGGSLDDSGKDGDREAKALAALCHSVMNSAAFLYID